MSPADIWDRYFLLNVIEMKEKFLRQSKPDKIIYIASIPGDDESHKRKLCEKLPFRTVVVSRENKKLLYGRNEEDILFYF